MAFIITNQSYTAGDRGALVISATNRDTTTAAGHFVAIDLLGESGQNQLSYHLDQASGTTGQTHIQINAALRSGDTVTASDQVWITIDTDPSRGN